MDKPPREAFHAHIPDDDPTTNDDRASAAWAALAAYAQRTCTGMTAEELASEKETLVADLLGDLRHLARSHGLDFAAVDARAHTNFLLETGEEPTTALTLPTEWTPQAATQFLDRLPADAFELLAAAFRKPSDPGTLIERDDPPSAGTGPDGV